MRTDPFRDEVAIDFPSTGRFVERVRAGFVGEQRSSVDDTVRAEVSVSRHEARRGVVLPLDLSLRSTCHICGGRGETWEDPCAECNSTGETLVPCRVRVHVPPGIADGGELRMRVRAPQATRAVRVDLRVAVRPLI